VALTIPVREVLDATARARIVRLDLGGVDFPYRAGQAVHVAAHGGGTRRAYSLAQAPEDTKQNGMLELLVGVDADGRAGDLPLAVGSRLDVEGPVGRFVFPDSPREKRFAFIAGGTGIAPLRAMVRHALHIPHRRICLLYSARTTTDFAYESELRALAHNGLIDLWQTVTRENDDTGWSGPRGRIGRDALAPLVEDPATLCFICGPRALVDEIPLLLRNLGVAEERIRIEEW
jgi:ferredoxin-NADP reductase